MYKTIKRKHMLYKTAVDYSVDENGNPINDYAMNHVLGCSHGCKYPCYAMSQALRWKQVGSYEDWCEPTIVENTTELLEKELAAFRYDDAESGSTTIYVGIEPKFSDPFDETSCVASALTDIEANLGYKASEAANGILKITLPTWKCDKHHGDDIRKVLKRWDISYRFPNKQTPPKRVHMCFTTDPFPYLAWDDFLANYRFTEGGVGGHVVPVQWEIQDKTMAAAEIINAHGIPVTVLTKGLLPRFEFGEDGPLFCRGREGYSKAWANPHPDNYYGISLASDNEAFREEWEPNTAPYHERIESLRHLHDAGCKTWVSMEPFPALTWAGTIERYGYRTITDHGAGKMNIPKGSERDMGVFHEEPFHMLQSCLSEVDFVDRIVFGRWNYNKSMPTDAGDPDKWYHLAAEVVHGFCAMRGIECVIKKGTE